MPHYSYYIHFDLLDEANHLFNARKYKLALEKYSIIFELLRLYNGDSMYPAMLSSELNKKIDICQRNKGFFDRSKPTTISASYILSKSTYVRGLQCKKSLYLNKYLSNERTPPSEERQKLFQFGRDFEFNFKSTFKNAVDVKEILGKHINKYPYYTDRLLNKNEEIIIFEAGFIFDDILILTDVLKKNLDGSYEIFEVKSSTEISDVIISDLTLQFYVLNSLLNKINGFNLVLRKENDDFNIINVTDILKENLNEIKNNISEFKEILNSKIIPNISMGNHCDTPYECDFKDYCIKQSL